MPYQGNRNRGANMKHANRWKNCDQPNTGKYQLWHPDTCDRT